MTTTHTEIYTLTRHAARTQIRAELSERFPSTCFDVTEAHPDMLVTWTDGPTLAQVREVTDRYHGQEYDDTYRRMMNVTTLDRHGHQMQCMFPRTATCRILTPGYKAHLARVGATMCGMQSPLHPRTYYTAESVMPIVEATGAVALRTGTCTGDQLVGFMAEYPDAIPD